MVHNNESNHTSLKTYEKITGPLGADIGNGYTRGYCGARQVAARWVGPKEKPRSGMMVFALRFRIIE
jgi:hypothetical protein